MENMVVFDRCVSLGHWLRKTSLGGLIIIKTMDEIGVDQFPHAAAGARERLVRWVVGLIASTRRGMFAEPPPAYASQL